jgi:O-antigen ligase
MKRWVKGIGDLVMVLVVVTERDPGVALRALMVRLGFLLMPISVLLIKYFPEFGRGIENYTWEPIVLGVTTNKNQLGMISMICGLAATWRLLLQIRGNEKRRAGSIVAQSVVLSTALWLFWQANSMTALSCFGLATMLMTAMMLTNVARRPLAPHLLAVVVFAGAFASLFLNVGGDALQMMGRDSSLTGRTDIWDTVLRVSGSSLVGTGYESFWLGERLQEIWSAYWWQPNEAHNGYLEVFLNLGGLGLCLLAFAFIASYGRAVAAVRAESAEGAFKYSYLVVWTVYNFTESVTRSFQPLWSLFLLMAIAVPEAKPLAETEAVRRRRPEPHHFGSPIVAPRMRSHFAGSRRVEVTTRSSRP